jgi:NitT/TauT family transport system substrate-binding protein
VTVEEYREYDAGTTLFSIEDNLAAYEEGEDYTSLHYAAEEIADFLVASEFVETRPDLTGVFDDTFVQAAAGN